MSMIICLFFVQLFLTFIQNLLTIDTNVFHSNAFRKKIRVFVVKDDLAELRKTKDRLNQVSMCGKLAQVMLIMLAYYILIMGSNIEMSTIKLLQRYLGL